MFALVLGELPMSFVHILFLNDPFVGVPATDDVEGVIELVDAATAAEVDKTEAFKLVVVTEVVIVDGVVSGPPIADEASQPFEAKLVDGIFDIC